MKNGGREFICLPVLSLFDLLNFSFIHYSFFYVVNTKDIDGERLIAINSLKKPPGATVAKFTGKRISF